VAEAIPLAAPRRSAAAAWPVVAFVATLAAGLFTARAAHRHDAAAAAGDVAVALAFVTCGAIVWARDRSGGLSGPLMVATGVAWLLGDLADEFALLHRGPLVQLLVAAPTGRPRTWPERLVVLAGYVDAIAPGVGRDEGAAVALAVAVTVIAVARWASAGGVQRRARAVPAAATVAIGLVLVGGAVADPEHAEAVLWSYEAVLIITAAALFFDLRRGWSEEALTRVVIDLGDSPRGGTLTDALARAVGDPSLVLAYVVDGGVVVDEAGDRVELPGGATDRAVTSIEAGDRVAAVLVHDAAALRAPGLADSVAAAVRLALDNVGLESRIRARVRDVEASRARLVAARDSELRSLDARLRAGVEPRLERAAQALAGLERDPEPLVRVLTDDLRRAREELARFAAGLHPVGLDSGGLPHALDALATTTPLRVELTVACGRLAEDVELAAWFVCSEALANVVKHAAAGRVTIGAQRSGGRLLVTVADDGRGGADPAAGRGLRGLAARVEAAGGSLEVGERPGGGTLLRASLPARERA
jgi:signal transduction histidine kinase